jgi:hypothetical protein
MEASTIDITERPNVINTSLRNGMHIGIDKKYCKKTKKGGKHERKHSPDGRGNEEGKRYIYMGVPRDVYEEMGAAESIGKYFYANIKGAYDYNRYHEPEKEEATEENG